jgi:hypothetical protein
LTRHDCSIQRSVEPDAFDIDEFILREFGIRIGSAPLNLVLRIRGVLAKYLAETPVATNQTMTPVDAEWTRVHVSVQDTVQLRTWLRSLGPDAVVDEPESPSGFSSSVSGMILVSSVWGVTTESK